MFRDIGWPEIIVILVVVMIIFGVGKLPQVGRGLGEAINEFRGSVNKKSEDKPAEDAKPEDSKS